MDHRYLPATVRTSTSVSDVKYHRHNRQWMTPTHRFDPSVRSLVSQLPSDQSDCILHRQARFCPEREGLTCMKCPAKTPGGDIPQAPDDLGRREKLCAATKMIATGGHTRRGGAPRIIDVGAPASPWMHRSGATCGCKSRWTVLASQQTGSRFDESERGRLRPSGLFSGNSAWRSRDRPADCNSQKFPGPTVGQSSIRAAP